MFKVLATLRSEAPLFESVDDLEWRGPRDDFDAWAEKVGDARLAQRVGKLSAAR